MTSLNANASTFCCLNRACTATNRAPSIRPSKESHSRAYLKLQNNRPFFNTKSSFFRGNSPFFLHFRQKRLKNMSFLLQFAVLNRLVPRFLAADRDVFDERCLGAVGEADRVAPREVVEKEEHLLRAGAEVVVHLGDRRQIPSNAKSFFNRNRLNQGQKYIFCTAFPVNTEAPDYIIRIA